MAEMQPVKITETILRDAHQSLCATRMRISQMLEEETGQSETELVYMRKGGHPFFGKVREEEGWDPAAGVAAEDS